MGYESNRKHEQRKTNNHDFTNQNYDYTDSIDFWCFFFIHVRRIVIFVCKIEFKAKSQELLAKNNSFNIFT